MEAKEKDQKPCMYSIGTGFEDKLCSLFHLKNK